MTTVADLIVHRLREAGVHTLFGMPGGGSNIDLVQAAGCAGLPFVLSHTETAGALMASAQAEVTGRPGACVATLGPGVASLVNGAAHAWLDRVPLVLLTDSLPAGSRDRFTHQRLDHRALLAPVTKASLTLDAERADQITCRALALAAERPQGPVHLDCAAEVSQRECSRESAPRAAPIAPAADARVEAPTPASVACAEHPLVIAGLGARGAEDVVAIRAFCERHGIPAMVTYKAKGVVPDDHALFAGVFTNGALERPLVESADLLIGIGLDPVELLPRPWTYTQPFIFCGRWLPEQHHIPVAAALVGDLACALRTLDGRLPAASQWRASEIRAQADRQRAAHRIDTPGWAPYRVVETAARVFDAGVRVTVDAGAHMFPVMALWPARQPLQILISNGLSTMGFALPAAIGLALLDRREPVAALTGDGGLLMCLAELATAARERLRITVVVFDDHSLSLIRIKQERLGYRAAGVSLDGIDWRAAGAAFGVLTRRAAGDAELERCLEEALTVDGPVLIDAAVDPGSYQATLRAVRG